MKQLVLDLLLPAPNSFADFVAGDNAEPLYQIGQWLAGDIHARSIYLWGEAGTGKSHLLASAARQIGNEGIYTDATDHNIPESIPGNAFLIVDNVDALDYDEQIRVFDHYNTLKEGGGFFLAAGPLPPMLLELRADLTTRLGWGLVYQIHPLSDIDKAQALKQRAIQLGFELSEEMADYLLLHAARDLPSLYSHLEAVNTLALSRKKPVTLSLLRSVLQQDQLAMDF
ncbi:DnaA regulatory inactivator Hda [Chitinilyticum piscinae]|uniref:DnaA regulatory inactivator Hda n=1 Tax=Chitinilyticum piscinae TaxID=2866724 RepID=A0A8J7FM97_9NEIS|nr:DnaA regulatory inactivator Hda [Chitinilyticum piscinae]MBE9610557.1 DnaA regulatory inactivator Hda [Chitinilyticum piscinae]